MKKLFSMVTIYLFSMPLRLLLWPLLRFFAPLALYSLSVGTHKRQKNRRKQRSLLPGVLCCAAICCAVLWYALQRLKRHAMPKKRKQRGESAEQALTRLRSHEASEDLAADSDTKNMVYTLPVGTVRSLTITLQPGVADSQAQIKVEFC